MFRALTLQSSGGQIVLSQHLVSSLSVQYSTVCRMTADCRSYAQIIFPCILQKFISKYIYVVTKQAI